MHCATLSCGRKQVLTCSSVPPNAQLKQVNVHLPNLHSLARYAHNSWLAPRVCVRVCVCISVCSTPVAGLCAAGFVPDFVAQGQMRWQLPNHCLTRELWAKWCIHAVVVCIERWSNRKFFLIVSCALCRRKLSAKQMPPSRLAPHLHNTGLPTPLPAPLPAWAANSDPKRQPTSSGGRPKSLAE